MLDGLKLILPEWPHYRVIHSKYPPQNLFSEDSFSNYILGLVESETSNRTLISLVSDDSLVSEYDMLLSNRDSYVDVGDFRFGNGWGAVMASFAYPREGRYSTDSIGAYYCANSVPVAITEWAYHAQKYWYEEMRFTNEVSAVVRCYTGGFQEPLLDVRNNPSLVTNDYAANHALLAKARSQNLFGILYDSARFQGGICAALLRPPATTKVTQSGHYTLMYDGQKFTDYAKLGAFHKL